MSGQKRRWPDWPESASGQGPPKAARLSPEPGPSWRTDPCAILTDLEKLCDHSPQRLLPFLLDHDYQLEQVVESPGLSPARVYTLLRALKVAVESAGEPELVQPVLALVLRPAFMLRSLLGFIAELQNFQHQDGQISQEVMEDTVAALHHLLTASPEQTKTLLCYPVDLLFATVQRLQSRGFQFTWIIQKRLHDTKILVDSTFPRCSVPLTSPAWQEDFHMIPIFPTPEEIFVDPGQKLKRNLPVGKYASDVAYLDTHFRLLREDFVRPLRTGISAHFSLQNVFGGAGKQRGLRVYRKVQLAKVGTSPVSAMYMARFQAPQGSSHTSSKRLLSGSLTCLISSDCGQVLFGTVVGGNRPELLKGAVWLDIKANHSDLLMRHLGKTNFIMVESPAFFESYRHVLEGLQELDPTQMPFQNYVVQCRTPIAPPAHFGEDVTFDLSVLHPTGRADKEPMRDTSEGHVTAVDLTAVRLGDSYIWSPATFPHLDESQILAIRMALTREFVLIQGPPGTGKTFIGLQIVEILLRNQSQWWKDQRPFLVVCYTNHALDQFMEGTWDYQALGICPQPLGFQGASHSTLGCPCADSPWQGKIAVFPQQTLSQLHSSIWPSLCSAPWRGLVPSRVLCSRYGCRGSSAPGMAVMGTELRVRLALSRALHPGYSRPWHRCCAPGTAGPVLGTAPWVQPIPAWVLRSGYGCRRCCPLGSVLQVWLSRALRFGYGQSCPGHCTLGTAGPSAGAALWVWLSWVLRSGYGCRGC
ncbi:NFX1-type zinc finger-containing protein 1-like [Gopherus flavomarginatus]|uniref:NFX1-type zinc finger-containing protein 1-like n=1 Tax=Gopherus flavomarginatus TaxID=286002 RepID=UPI0021CBFD1F|nr:NFX1-type zinc finger-containing protein 1-like [Gopherus flavomarginatus]